MKISSEYSGHRIIKILATAHLANAGLEWSDVEGVPTVNILGNANDFTQGKTDAGFFAVASGKVKQVNAAVGGIRFLNMNDSPEAVERMRKVVPPATVISLKPRKGLVGLDGPTNLMVYDYLLYAGAHVSDDVVYKITKMMAENKPALAAAFGGFNWPVSRQDAQETRSRISSRRDEVLQGSRFDEIDLRVPCSQPGPRPPGSRLEQRLVGSSEPFPDAVHK